MTNQFLDKDGTNLLWSRIKQLFVAKEEGKGLSTNDYTTEEKEKLASLSNGGGGSQTRYCGNVYGNATTTVEVLNLVGTGFVDIRAYFRGSASSITLTIDGVSKTYSTSATKQYLVKYFSSGGTNFNSICLALVTTATTGEYQSAKIYFSESIIVTIQGQTSTNSTYYSIDYDYSA